MMTLNASLQPLAAMLMLVLAGGTNARCIDSVPTTIPASEQQPADKPTRGAWGDQGDGTYANPILPADFSDLDAIRVGRDYYAMSSTMQYSPGIAILHSRDLVNWEIISHVVSDLTVLDPELNWDKMNRAGRGIWAGAIRYHDGMFRAYFGTPDQGIFVSTAASASGPWTQARLVLASAGWDDPCPFWDDDGQAYLVTTHFAPEGDSGVPYNIHLFKMNAASDQLFKESDRILHQSQGSEANKLYKIHGIYYHLYSEVAAEGRVVRMERSLSLNGPWVSRQLIHVNAAVDKEPNQGGLVELPSGKWYFVSHQGSGDWEGRAGVLLPVTWIDGWPILGRVGGDGIGNMTWRGEKPIRSVGRTAPFVRDEFSKPELKPEWEWNYQPRAKMWSLLERPGFLRLRAYPPLSPSHFETTGNVLTQRAFRSSRAEVTVKLDLAGMANGQESGIVHFSTNYCTLTVIQDRGIRRLSYNNNGKRVDGPKIISNILYLRSAWNFDGVSHFSYSTDGVTFRLIGEQYLLTWGAYRGDRIGVFTVNDNAAEGYLDIDSFQYRVSTGRSRH